MKRNRTKRLSLKVAILVITLLTALGMMSISYAAWTDTVTMNNQVTIGYTDYSIININCACTGGVIDCSSFPGVVITNPEPLEDYIIEFFVSNDGSIPLDIESITTSSLPVGMYLFDLQGAGMQVDPGDSQFCQIHLRSYESPAPESGSFIVIVNVVLWNS